MLDFLLLYIIMKKLYASYIASFKGLSKEIWYLSFISLINRAGTMVIPFLSLYLTNDLNFKKPQVKWVLVCFGIGSVIGSWLGGKLTDNIGFYKVMVISLFLTGINFIILQYITSFLYLCIAILITMSIADSFRPAVFVSIKEFSKPENQTRSIALLRLAINAGMGVGPTLAGLIIVTNSYDLLFWIDGLTCIVAIIVFYFLVKNPNKKSPVNSDEEKTLTKEGKNITKNVIYKDLSYWLFCSICFLFGMGFFQLFTIFPLYYNKVFDLNEFKIGLIMFINIAIIVILEMPFISYLEKRFIMVTKYIITSLVLLSLSFFVLYQNYWIGILLVSIIIITFSEMLGFPYTNKFAIKRSKDGFEGSYMAMYTISFSLAHIFCPLLSFSIIDTYGYQINWLITGCYCLLAVALSYWLHKRIKNNR